MTAIVEELIYISIDGLQYVYSLEKCFHQKFFNHLKYAPMRAVNYLKQMCLWHERIESCTKSA